MELGLEIAKRIRELRISQNMTQEQLANDAKIDSSFLGRIERAQNPNLQIDTLEKIINALNVDYMTFFSFSNSENKMEKLINDISNSTNEDELVEIFKRIITLESKKES